MTDNQYSLIKKYADGKLTRQELDTMRKLLDSTGDVALKPVMQSIMDAQQDASPIDTALKDKMFNNIIVKTSPKMPANGNMQPETAGKARTIRLLWIAAAVIALCVIGGAAVWYRQYTKVTPPVITAEVKSAIERSKATDLDEVIVTRLQGSSNKAIARQLEKYCNDAAVVEKLSEATQVSTHTDKEGWVTLDDGTLVHLNSDSRIFFPEHFGRGSRNVILDGEAYFMVATDHSRPFIVHTAHGDVKEYGTEFNVSARKGADAAEVVLVGGSIGVTPAGGQEKMMQPGMLCRMSATECALSLTDTEPYRAWNTGKVEFHDWTLERLMRIVCRWYGCKAEFAADSLKTERLSGMFDRYDSPATTLQALQTAVGLRFESEGGTITIAP